MLLSFDPCSLKVWFASDDKPQFTKSISMLAIGIELSAVYLKISLLTQFWEGAKADAVEAFPSNAFSILPVECGSNSVEIDTGFDNSTLVKKQIGDSTASKIPSLSSSISIKSVTPSPSVSVHALYEALSAYS